MSRILTYLWMSRILKEGTLLVRKGKGGKQRQLFLNDHIWKDLIRYRQQMQGDEYSPVFYAFSKNGSSTMKHALIVKITFRIFL